MKKAIVIYFSYTGHTKKVAEEIAKCLNCECVTIKKKKAYSKNPFIFYKPAEKEVKSEFCPEIVNDIQLDGYDAIILGTPIWWETMAPPVRTFLRDADLKDKFVMPFCTHGGGGAGYFVSDIKQTAMCNSVSAVLSINGKGGKDLPGKIKKWILELD